MTNASTADTLALTLSEAAYLGDAEFVITVDGVQVGGVQTVTAVAAYGQTQTFTVRGNFGTGPHVVGVTFVNPALGGTAATTRSLYLDSVSLDGTGIAANANVTGTTTQTITAASAPAATNTLTVNVAENAYQGNAQFVVLVDGKQVGGTQTVTALQSAGQSQNVTLTGNFGSGPHTVAVKFLNYAAGGRNLYVNSVTYDGSTTAVGTELKSNTSTKPVTVSDTAVVTPGAVVSSDSLTLYMAEDYYLGNATFTVSVNGQQVGGVMSATALHSAGAQQPFTFYGNWGAGPVAVAVTYLNDTSGSTGDRNLYVNAISYDGVSQPGQSAALVSNGSKTFDAQANTLVLNMSEDYYLGNAQFTVAINGQQVGGVMTVTALHQQGQEEAFAFDGSYGTGPQSVVVTFLNDANNGSSGDRNLYVDSISYNGVVQAGQSAPLFSNGSATFTVQTDTLTLGMSEDAYNGDAQFTVTVNGKQLGGIMTAIALHRLGASEAFTFNGTYGAGPVSVVVTYLNDATNGGSGDRNLYVNSVTYDGVLQTGQSAPLYSNGSATFTAQETTVPPPATDTLTIYVSEDAYMGDAEFSVTVDGAPVGGVQTATASHANGDEQGVTLTGAFGAGAHTVVVTFLNDANGPTGDRNLYVDGIEYNGSYTGVNAALFSTGNASTTVVGGTPAPSTLPLLSPAGTFKYVGVDLSGLEFGSNVFPGVLNHDYVEPTHAEIDYYASEGMNVIRLPFDWERVQPVMNGPLDQNYLSLMDDVVSYAASKGITVDLGLGSFGYYYGQPIGGTAVPNSAFANVWSQLAAHYASTPNVMFGLMGEPAQQTPAQWLAAANGAIGAIRAAGATQEILVPGTDYDGGESWESSGNAAVMGGIVDPRMNFAYEIHQYLDANSSGQSMSVVSPEIGVDRLTEVTEWAQTIGAKLFLAEFGATSDPASLTANQNMLNYMAQNTNVWQAAVEWGGGPWWGSYGFATDPVNGVTTPQVNMLKTYE